MYNKILMNFSPISSQFDKQTTKLIELYTLPCFHPKVIWWLKPWCASIRSLVQSLMDVCINKSRTNVVNKHAHPNESIKTYLLTKSEFFLIYNFKKKIHDM